MRYDGTRIPSSVGASIVTDEVQQAMQFQDLLKTESGRTPYLFGEMFEDGGFMARLRSRRRFKLLKRIDEELLRILDDGEQVHFLTKGAEFSSSWFSFGVFLDLFVSKCQLVVTNRRLLVVDIPSGDHSLRRGYQVCLSAILGVARGYNRINVVSQNGDSHYICDFPNGDVNALVEILDDLRGGQRTEAGGDAGAESLCPHCCRPVEGNPAACPQCQGAFKPVRKAMILSLICPGLGSLFLGYRAAGLIEMIAHVVVWTPLFLCVLLLGTGLDNVGYAMALFFFVVVMATAHGWRWLWFRAFHKDRLYAAGHEGAL